MTVLDTIGRTRLFPLQRMVPEGSARILLKLEYENPTGSMKDRMALAMVEAAEADGRLRPGGSVVEYTGGSTGVSLAFVCAAKRIPLQIVTSEAFSTEKRSHMKALGASLTLVSSPTGGTTKALTLEMIETARRLASAPGSYWTDQLNNTDQLASYERMGEEIWEQTGGHVDAFVQSVGTAGSLRGISTRLRAITRRCASSRWSPRSRPCCRAGRAGRTRSRAPAPGSSCRSGRARSPTRSRRYRRRRRWRPPGASPGRKGSLPAPPPGRTWRWRCGWPARLGPGQTVVTLAVDSGMKYLSTALYAQA